MRFPKRKNKAIKRERERDSHYLRVKGWRSHVEYQNNFKLNGRKDKETISTSQGAHNLPMKGGGSTYTRSPISIPSTYSLFKLILMS